jgi:hypothetical protein
MAPARELVCNEWTRKQAVMGQIRIPLADDHIEILEELRALLHNQYEVVGAAQNG